MIIVKEKIEPSLIKTADLFTDREDASKRLCEVYDLVKNTNGGVFVISICGIGGIGKSVLIDKMIDTLISQKSEYIFYSFETNRENQKTNFLLNFAYQILEKKPETDMSRFLYAYKSLLSFGAPEEQVVKELASTQFVRKRGLIELANSVISDYLPFGGNTFSLLVDKALNMVESKERKKYKNDIDGISKDELSKKLHEYFSSDAFSYFKDLSSPYVVFLDGYEKYKSPGGDCEKNDDGWLMEMVMALPNVLWVFSGREPLDWSEEYGVENIQLNAFSAEYVKEYFKKYEETYNEVGLADEIVNYIYELTQGVPIYLRICLDNYDKFPQKDKIKKEDIGKNTKELLKRFFNNYSEDQKMAMYYLCCLPDGFTEGESFEIFNMIDTGKTGLHYDLGILYSLKNTAAFEVNGNRIRIHSVVKQSVLENAKGMDRIEVIAAITDAIGKFANKYEAHFMWGAAIRFRVEICSCWEIWGNTHKGWEEHLAKEELLLANCYSRRYKKLFDKCDAELALKCCDRALNYLKLIKEPWDWSVLEAEYEKICSLQNMGDWDMIKILSQSCFERVKANHKDERCRVFNYVFDLWNASCEENEEMLLYIANMRKEGINEELPGIKEKIEYLQHYDEMKELNDFFITNEDYLLEQEAMAQELQSQEEREIKEYEAFVNEYYEEKIYDENSLNKYMILANHLRYGCYLITEAEDVWKKLYVAEKNKNEGKDTIQSVKILIEMAESMNEPMLDSLSGAENKLKEVYEIIKANSNLQIESMLGEVVLKIAQICEMQEKIEEALKYYCELNELLNCNQKELMDKEKLHDKIREIKALL